MSKQKQVRKATNAQGLSRWALITMFSLLLTKITGFLREILIVPIFGLGALSDGYRLGFSIPDLFYQMLIGGSISAVITPMLSAAIERDEEERAWKAVSTFITAAMLTMAALVLIGQIFSPQLLTLINPGKSQETLNVAVRASRILYFQSWLMVLIALVNGVLHAYKIYGWASLGNTVYNISCTLALVVLGSATVRGVSRASVGIVISAAVYLGYILWHAREPMARFRPQLEVKEADFTRLLRMALPALLAGSILQINNIVQMGFTNQFTGAVTLLGNAQTLWGVPYGIIAVGLGQVLLPNLSGFLARDAVKDARELYGSVLRMAMFLIIPVALFFAIQSSDTVRVIFQWSASYTNEAVDATGRLLRWFCISMVAQTIVFLTNQVFFALQRSWITLLNGVISLLINPFFYWLFIKVLDLGFEGVAVAHAVYSLVIVIFVNLLLRRMAAYTVPRGLTRYAAQIFLCALPAIALSFLFYIGPPLPANKLLQILAYALELLLVYLIFFLMAWLLRLPEVSGMTKLWRKIKQRIQMRS